MYTTFRSDVWCPIALWVVMLPGAAVEYEVSLTGDDAAAGTVAAPLRTINAAAKRAVAGDTVIIRAGTYRETVVPSTSGAPGQPITYRSAAGERVVIDGTEPVTGWEPYRDGLEQAPMAGDWFSRATPGDGVHLYDAAVHNQADQVFVDGKMVILARWPNSASLDPSFPGKAVCEKFVSKNLDAQQQWTVGVLEDAQFSLTAEQAVGAQVMVQPNFAAWAWIFTGRISAVEGQRFTYMSRSGAGKDGAQNQLADQSRYVVFDKLALLDAPGEWYHDKPSDRLFLKSPDGAPLTGRVTAKKREYAFDLSGLSHITIADIHIHACTITTDRAAGGDNIPYDEQGETRYPWRNAALTSPKQPWHQPDTYQDAPSTNVIIERVQGSYLSHFTDVSGHFFCQWAQSSGIVLSGRQHQIRDCHIRWSSGNGITLLGREHRALGNLIEDTNYAANDCAAIHTGGTERGSSDHDIGWNTIRRTGRSGMLPRSMYRSADELVVQLNDSQPSASQPSDSQSSDSQSSDSQSSDSQSSDSQSSDSQSSDRQQSKGRIHHNDISVFGIQDWDQGGIYGAGEGGFLHLDHNVIHDAYEQVDDLGSGAFTASGIYPDYARTWLIHHNVIWNVEWAIHLQNQSDHAIPAGFVVLNNSLAVRTLGGVRGGYGPFGVVRNSDAPFQQSVIADNVIVILDQSAGFKPVDFASDSTFSRVVENNVSGKTFTSLGLVGGALSSEAFVPTSTATEIINQPLRPVLESVAGVRVPTYTPTPYRGAFAPGVSPWKAGHTNWPERASLVPGALVPPPVLAGTPSVPPASSQAPTASQLPQAVPSSWSSPSASTLLFGVLTLILFVFFTIVFVRTSTQKQVPVRRKGRAHRK